MSGQFKVGEIAIGQHARYALEFNGMECEVIAAGHLPYRCLSTLRKVTGLGYHVRWANGLVTFAESHQLRRRKPPESDSGELAFMDRIRELASKAPQRDGVPA